MLWSWVALALGGLIAAGCLVTVAGGVKHHRRDVRILDMRNHGLDVPTIARELGSTEAEIHARMKRIAGAGGLGPPAG
ncbi:MAG: hypothetical protein HYZ39_04150 [Mycolicibacterium cosmeticum]|nr:hypothetical protein [Mycolicibacterium cosmeticum]